MKIFLAINAIVFRISKRIPSRHQFQSHRARWFRLLSKLHTKKVERTPILSNFHNSILGMNVDPDKKIEAHSLRK